MLKRRILLVFVFLPILSWSITSACFAQATYGNIIGTVTDPGGDLVPGVQVTAANTDTGVSVNAQSNESGNYEVTHLLPGAYKVSFALQGFETFVQENVTVSVGQSSPVNVALQVGSVKENITVTAAPPLLETDRAEVSTRLDDQTLEHIPVLNRNFTNFELLLPGNVKNNFQHPLNENPSNDILVNTNGQEYAGDNFVIDGASNNDAVLGIIAVNPPLDSIGETKVSTSNYDPEFSQAVGSVIQVQTKSGTNKLHGSAFEYLQNDVLQSRDPFTEGLHAPGTRAPVHRGLPELRWNEFGGSLGGPIKKNKAFFFVDYQGNRENLGGSVLTRVPTAAERTGNLSDLGVTLYNPATGNPDGSGRQVFSGGIIPANLINKPAANLLALLPQPNVPGATGASPNYAATGVNSYNTNQFDIRIDHYYNDKLNYFGRFSYDKVSVLSPGAFVLYGGPEVSPQGVNIYEGNSDDLDDNGVLGVNYVFSSNLLTDFRFSTTRYRIQESPLDIGQQLANQVGLPGLNLPGRPDTFGLPDINVNGTGGFNMGYQCNCPLQETENLFDWVTNWTNIRGNHTLKWGAQIERAQNLRLPSDNHRAGVFTFADTVTASRENPGAGAGLASFLLGDPASFARFSQLSTNQQDRQTRMFYYGQDTWRVTPKLTLNYGVRWDTWFPDTSLHPGQGGRYEIGSNTVFIPGVDGVSSNGNAKTQWHNFSPRFAIAYALTPNTVIRTGYGWSYNQGTFGWTFNDLAADVYPSIVNQVNTPPPNQFFPFQFASGVSLSNPSFGTAPPPVVFPAIPPNGRLPLANGIGVSYIPRHQPIPHVNSWNFTVQHQVGSDITVSVGYVGNVGRNLNMGYNLNEPIPGPGIATSREPYFQLYGLTQTIFDKCDCEGSNYQSLQVQVVKRFSNSLSLIANYTYQRAFDFGEFGTPTDQYDTLRDYGPASFNRTHVLTVGHTYFLPFGTGQHWLANWDGAWGRLISGWQWSGFTTLESGMPFSATLASNGSLNSTQSIRPNKIGNPFAGTPHDRNQWFNPAAFAVPGPFLFGDASRNALTGAPLFSADWAIFKNFKITENFNLQFRWEVYNAFNYTNVQNPSNTNTDTPTAGIITDIQSPMRNMQFGLHLTW